MGMNPVDSFLNSMNTTSQILRSNRNAKREDQLFNMKMDAYREDRADRQEEKQNRAKKREIASDLVELQGGSYGADDVARLDKGAGGRFEDIFDEKKQDEALNYVMPIINRVGQGGQLADNEREPIWAASSALMVNGVLSPTVAGIKEQAQALPPFKQKVVSLSEMAKGQLMGKKTRIDEQADPELFAMFAKAFPAVSNGSSVFKDGAGRPVEFFIDATGVDRIQDARVVPLLEGVNPKTGEVYRAPMSMKRSNDPNDVLATKKLGEIYAQADFAERASNALLASLAGMDDAEAQRVIDRYIAEADRVKQEQRKRAASGKQADALSGLIGFSKDESAAYKKAVESGADPKAAAELLIKKKEGKKTEVVWRDNVDIGGKPYQVAYDKQSGEQVKAVPQWVKSEKGSSKSSSGGGKNESALPRHIMAMFEIPEQFNEQGFSIAGKTVDQKRLGDFVAFKSRYGHDMSYEDAYAQFAKKEGQGGAGKSSVYGQIPGGEKADESAQRVVRALENISGVEERAAAAKQFMQSDAPDDVKQRFNYYFSSQQIKTQSGMQSDKRKQTYGAGRGMAPISTNMLAVKPKQRMIAGKVVSDQEYNQATDDVGNKILGGSYQFIMTGLNQLADYFVMNPARAMASDIAAPFQAFRQWAQSRYKKSGAEKSPEALAEYAKENPDGAQKIVAAAEIAAQAGTGMAR